MAPVPQMPRAIFSRAKRSSGPGAGPGSWTHTQDASLGCSQKLVKTVQPRRGHTSLLSVKFLLPSGNSTTADLRRHAERPEGEISERGAVSPSLGQPRQNKKVNHQSASGGGLTTPNGREQSRLSEHSHHCSHPESSGSTPDAVFKELGKPKVGHVLKPKGKLSRPQLPCSQLEDHADSPGGQVASETCPTILGIPGFWLLPQPSAF